MVGSPGLGTMTRCEAGGSMDQLLRAAGRGIDRLCGDSGRAGGGGGLRGRENSCQDGTTGTDRQRIDVKTPRIALPG